MFNSFSSSTVIKIGCVLEQRVKTLLNNNFKSVTESQFSNRLHQTYPFLDSSISLKANLEYWYIYDAITLCNHNQFSEYEYRCRALSNVKKRSDYLSLSCFQLLDFLYLIDSLIWVDNRMVGIQIATMRSSSESSDSEFSKYSSIRSFAKRGLHSWLDAMIVIYSDINCVNDPLSRNKLIINDSLSIKSNQVQLISSIKQIANSKPLLRTLKNYSIPSSIYNNYFDNKRKPFLITINQNGVKFTNRKVTNNYNTSLSSLV